LRQKEVCILSKGNVALSIKLEVAVEKILLLLVASQL